MTNKTWIKLGKAMEEVASWCFAIGFMVAVIYFITHI